MRAATVIISGGRILLIHRCYGGREYYVVPGGGSEQGESAEQTAIREAREETGLAVTLGKRLWEFREPRDGRLHVYFLVERFSGEVRLGGPEAEENSPSNSFKLEWRSLDELPSLPLVPEPVKESLIREFCDGPS